MNILVACEESQEIAKRFRQNGHNAFSCDIVECSGGHPEFHIVHNVLHLIYGNCFFQTQDFKEHYIPKWDLIIAHPPCTYLTVCGNSWFNIEKYGERAIERYINRVCAIDFFMQFVYCDCPRIAIENPIGIMSSVFRKPDQIIQPYQFGDPERKPTCLWLKNLPNLKPTNIVEPNIIKYKNGKGSDDFWHFSTIGLPKEERQKIRSKTFPGIAEAIVNQWGLL